MSYILNDNSFNSWIDKKPIKLVNTFLNHLKKETLTLKLIYLIIATKADLKNARGVDTSQLAWKSGLASLEAEVDKIDVEN